MQTLVKELIKTYVFSDSTIITGNTGIDNPVQSLMIVSPTDEDTHIGKGAFLVLISNQSDSVDYDQDFLIKRICSARPAALGLKEHLLKQFDERFISTLQKNKILIIRLPDSFSYTNFLMLEVNQIEKLYVDFRNMNTTHGLQGIVSLLKVMTGHPAAVFLGDRIIPSSKISFPEDFMTLLTHASAEQEGYSTLRTLSLMKEIDNHPIVLDGKIFHWISLELLVDNEGLGTIGLLSEEEKINEDGYLLLEIAGNVCEYEIERLVAVEKEQNKQKSLFMEQILSGNLPVYEVAKERAQIHQWDLQPETTVILIDPIDLDAGLLQRVISLLQRYLSDMDLKNHPISSVESHIIMLLPQKEFTQPKMLSDLHNFLLRKDIPTRICVGSQVPFRHLNKSYADSRQALLLAGYQDRPICYFQKLGVYRLLNHPFSKMVILEFHNQYVEPILAFDKRHHADLYETILAYFQAGGNYAKTGAALYVHANTIRYRISTIEKVCKLNLSEEDDRLSLELALRLSPFLEIPSD